MEIIVFQLKCSFPRLLRTLGCRTRREHMQRLHPEESRMKTHHLAYNIVCNTKILREEFPFHECLTYKLRFVWTV
jgi:hypothetical protein